MIVVDVETGGLDPIKNPLLAIGAKDYKNGDEFYVEISPLPYLEITEQALAVNGFNKNQWDNIDLHQAMNSFAGWLQNRDCKLAGHNPYFDLSFLRASFTTTGVKNPFGHRTIDMHTLGYLKFGYSLTSDQIYVELGMPEEPRPHNAMTGARMEYSAFEKLGVSHG